MSDLELAVYHMLNVWRQYNSWGSEENKFSHANMTAGEDACEFLERLGYGYDDGYHFCLNDKAIELMNKELE